MKKLIALAMASALALAPVCMAEGRGDLIIDRDGDGVEDIGYIAATAEDFIGSWQDETSQRAVMDVTMEDDVLHFTVSWSSSADEETVWTFTGIPADDGVVEYTDCTVTVNVYDESGEVSADVAGENGTGCTAIDTDGAMYWSDADAEVSSTMRFVKVG